MDWEEYKNELGDKIVEINNKKNNKGKISFEYKGLDQLNKIILFNVTFIALNIRKRNEKIKLSKLIVKENVNILYLSRIQH